MDKVYQVFVSSTFSDLEFERKQVSDTLAKSGFIPSGMELFPATDQQQLEFIKRIIDRSDYYVVIVAARYGSLDGDKSFTEKEFEYAVEKKIPVLAFIHKEPGKIESDKSEKDAEQIARLDSFKERLKASRIVAFWTNASDLRTEVLTAVTNSVNLSPGIGWVRGDQAIDPKVLQETERLRIENQKLRSQLAEALGSDLIFPADLAGPSDYFQLVVSGEVPVPNEHATKLSNQIVNVQLGKLFIAIFDRLLADPAEHSLRDIIGRASLRLSDNASIQENARYSVSTEQVRQLGCHYEALGLLQLMGQVSPNSFFRNEYISWTVTDKGRRFVTSVRAIPKNP